MRAFAMCIVGALLCAAPRPAASADTPPPLPPRPLVLAVPPYLTAAEVERRFAPLAAYIGRTLGQPVAVRIGGSYAAHIEAIGRDEVDIAFIGPAGYVRVLERYGSKPPLGRFEVGHSPSLRGVIAVPQGSPLRTVAELRGHRFAFGDPESTMGYFAAAWLLRSCDVPLAALSAREFLGSHTNVALGVLAGDFDAGAMKREVYDEYAMRGLRILAELPPTPDYLFVTRADLPPAAVQRLRAALLALDQTAAGARILESLHPGLTRLLPVSESDYQGVRDMIRAVGRAP